MTYYCWLYYLLIGTYRTKAIVRLLAISIYIFRIYMDHIWFVVLPLFVQLTQYLVVVHFVI